MYLKVILKLGNNFQIQFDNVPKSNFILNDDDLYLVILSYLHFLNREEFCYLKERNKKRKLPN
jgi:hypothetical protein